jgi:hypothetical protein
MRAITKLLARLALVLVALAAFTAPAFAAAPSNDTFANATLVTVGFSQQEIDTTEATTDSDDAQLLKTCPAPATDASVWYTIVGDGTKVAVDVTGSSYSAGVIVATLSQRKLETIACADGVVSFDAEAGTQYYVLAFDDQSDGGGNGGKLNITFSESRYPDINFSVDSYGKLDPSSGSATISGSYTCTAGASFEIFVDATQRKGQSTVVGSGDFQGECDGMAQRWTVVVEPESGKFTDAKLQTTSFGVASVPDLGVAYEINQKVKLRSGRK